MAYIERRLLEQRDRYGRVRTVTRYRVRYRDPSGKPHAETRRRLIDAERRKAEIEVELADSRWLDPRRGDVPLSLWAAEWVKTRHDLRPSTWARLGTSLRSQVLPKFGDLAISKITNAAIRVWVMQMLDEGLSPATARKAVFALRQCLGAAVEDNRIRSNPAVAVPLPSERRKPPRFLSQSEVERLVEEMPGQYEALVLLGAYAGLRWGEAVGLTRSDVDLLRSRVNVSSTAVEVNGTVTLGNEPKTARSRRSVPVARSVMRRVEHHLERYVATEPDALLFAGPTGGPLFRSFGLRVLKPAVARAGLGSITFHGLRHSFVAILVAAGCNVREVSEWAGHNSVAFTLTRYGGLFDDGTERAVDRLDALLGDPQTGSPKDTLDT